MALPGIGAWTAAQVVQVALGDADSVVIGDYNLPNLVAWNLAGEPRGSDDRMLELLEPYRGHRARVVRLIKAGGETPPRYGPRLQVMPIEAW
jgi:3-methyladenine DNA glycosylase/8-oxoguanine DNA glycosylase